MANAELDLGDLWMGSQTMVWTYLCVCLLYAAAPHLGP